MLLALFKDVKVDEIKKADAEVGIQGSAINIKITKKTSEGNVTKRYIISKNNNGSWNVKRYDVDKGIEKFVIEVTLKPGVSGQQNKEKRGKKEPEMVNKEIEPNVNSDEMDINSKLKEIEKIENDLKKMLAWLEGVKNTFGIRKNILGNKIWSEK